MGASLARGSGYNQQPWMPSLGFGRIQKSWYEPPQLHADKISVEDKRERQSLPGGGLLGLSPGVCHLAAHLHELPTAALAGLCCRDRVMCRSLPRDRWCPARGMFMLPRPTAVLGEFCTMNCDSAFILCRLFMLLRVHPSS